MPTSNNYFFIEKIVLWYKKHQRDLPWRKAKDPYLIWLSEIILQQTRVAQGLPYYLKFVDAFPTVERFALSTENEVLRLWQGLGYYSRGRNMLHTAQYIQQHLGGQFPANYKGLLKLKGVGSYTAAAIASFAYNEPVAVLDGNVFRVLARYFGITTDILSAKGKKEFSDLAQKLLPKDGSATYNQAIMEFGALQCSPSPNCDSCPLSSSCYAFSHKAQAKLPVKISTLKVKNRYLYYLIIENAGLFYLQKRTENGIWKGLYQFYLKEQPNVSSLEEISQDKNIHELLKNSVINSFSNEYNHKLTHQNLSIWFIHLKMDSKTHAFFLENRGDFFSQNEVANLPKPIVLANFFENNF